MEIYRIRVRLEDSPGQLGRVATALGEWSVNILEFDVLAVDGQSRVDEMLIQPQVPLDVPTLAFVLAEAGCEVTAINSSTAHDLVDPVTRSLRLARTVRAADHGDDDRLAEAVATLVHADIAFVSGPGDTPGPVELDASASGRVVQRTQPVKLLGPAPKPPWVAAVPFEAVGTQRVLVLARHGERFTVTEMARVQAFLALTCEAEEFASVERRRDGTAFQIRALHAADFSPYEQLHERCSPETLHSRYFVASRTVPSSLTRRMVDVGGDHIGIGAFDGSDLVGAAHATPAGRGERAEVALLVQDDEQRRGVGAALLHRLLGELAARDVVGVEAVTRPGSTAMPALFRGAGLTPTVERRDDVLVVTATLGDDVAARSSAVAVAD